MGRILARGHRPAQRWVRVDAVYTTTNEAHRKIAKAPNGFLVVAASPPYQVEKVFFYGIENRGDANRLKKKVHASLPEGQVLVLMHKVRQAEVPIGWAEKLKI